MWKAIVYRCTSEKEKVRRQSCLLSTCSEDWLDRSKFQEWYFSNKHFVDSKGEKLQIDKDIKYINNSVYSSETCFLVPKYVNLAVRKLSKGGVPWVSLTPKTIRMKNWFKKPYQYSILCDGITYKKSAFLTQKEAYMCAQAIKIDHLKTVLLRYKNEDCYIDQVGIGLENRIIILEKARAKNRICYIF